MRNEANLTIFILFYSENLSFFIMYSVKETQPSSVVVGNSPHNYYTNFINRVIYNETFNKFL